jgi:hypothetical protein
MPGERVGSKINIQVPDCHCTGSLLDILHTSKLPSRFTSFQNTNCNSPRPEIMVSWSKMISETKDVDTAKFRKHLK